MDDCCMNILENYKYNRFTTIYKHDPNWIIHGHRSNTQYMTQLVEERKLNGRRADFLFVVVRHKRTHKDHMTIHENIKRQLIGLWGRTITNKPRTSF